jgi:protein O-mannosyl-transferase
MSKRWIPVLLVLAVVAAWANSLGAPFTYDDKIEVLHPALRNWRAPEAIWAYNPGRFVVLCTYALNWAVGGVDPRGYHVVSVAVHALNAVLAWKLFGRLLSPGRAAVGAAAWALHPMCTESVTYTTGRSDAIAATFALAALSAWIDDARAPDWRRRSVALGAVAAGMITKETAFATPLLLLAAELFLVAGGRWRLVRWGRYAPLGLLLLTAGVARLWLAGWPVPEVPRSLTVHSATQAEVWLRYLALWVVPWGQSILQAVPARVGFLGGLGLVAWVALAAAAWRRGGVEAFAACLWALPLAVSSAPVLKETMSEHRSYQAGLAVALLAARWLPARRELLVVPLLLGALTVHRNLVWRDEPTLWRDATERWPHSRDAWQGYGDALRFARQWEAAERAYRTTYSLDPSDVDPLVNIAIGRGERRDLVGARELLEEALRVNPAHCAARNNLARVDLMEGAMGAAAGGYEGTLRACPDDALAHFNLGVIYARVGEQRQAIFHLKAYLRADPWGAQVPAAVERLRALGAGPRD